MTASTVIAVSGLTLRAEARTRSQGAGVRVGASHVPVRQATAMPTTTAPVKTPSVATETAAASASDAPTPEAIRAAVLAPTCVAAPAGPIGSAAAAAPAQRKRSASGDRVADSECAEEQEDGDRADEPAGRYERPRFGCAPQRGRSRAQPAAESRAQRASARGQAWQGDDHGRGYDSGETHYGEAGTDSDSRAWKGCGDEGEWCQGGAVDQSEHDEGQGECSHAGGTARVAADDRDPHRVVEAPGKDDAGEGCPAVAGRER